MVEVYTSTPWLGSSGLNLKSLSSFPATQRLHRFGRLVLHTSLLGHVANVTLRDVNA
jgi:hypothetical protein